MDIVIKVDTAVGHVVVDSNYFQKIDIFVDVHAVHSHDVDFPDDLDDECQYFYLTIIAL